MRDSLNMLSNQMREIWKQFGPSQRLSVVMSLTGAVLVLGALLYWGTRPDYRVLYSNLSLTDSSKMREKLEESKIPVKLGQSGMSISVPASKLYHARLMLASEGLPQDTSTGFELFEQPKFGLTDFAQKVNYQRALQGELERTVTAMQGIRNARVMLVLPKDHLFSTEEERKAQASVLLTTNGSMAPDDAQVQSIVHLIASSVQNLDPGQVTVTDQSGRLLTRSRSADSIMEHGNEQLDVQERTETRLVEKAQSILDRALGVGNSIVRVSAELDFSDTEQRNEMYDAENRVATSERIVSEDKTGGGSRTAGGRAGVVANVSVGSPNDMKVDASGDKDKSEEIYTEYIVPSNVSLVRKKGVGLRHLSVAVCISQQGDTPRSDAQKAEITALVSNALGVSQERGDTIQLTEMPFVAPAVPAESAWWERLPLSSDTLFRGAGGLFAFCFVLGASRKVKKILLAGSPSIEVPINEAREQEQERIMKEEPLEMENHLDAVGQMARDNPKTVAAWITNVADWNE
jgi:flagellar M-ring protein FliF